MKNLARKRAGTKSKQARYQANLRKRLTEIGWECDDEPLCLLDIGEACAAFLSRVETENLGKGWFEKGRYLLGPHYAVALLHRGVFTIAAERCVNHVFPVKQHFSFAQAHAFLCRYVIEGPMIINPVPTPTRSVREMQALLEGVSP